MKMRHAAAAMLVIIAVRMVLCLSVSVPMGDLFTNTASTALFVYACITQITAARQRAALLPAGRRAER